MNDGKKLLKIKVKSLAAEAKIIRKEELKLKTIKVEVPVKDRQGNVIRMKTRRKLAERHFQTFNALREHRVGTVREEARNTLVAYAFLRSRPFVKPKKATLDLQSIRRMIRKYGPVDLTYLPDNHEAIKAYMATFDDWRGLCK